MRTPTSLLARLLVFAGALVLTPDCAGQNETPEEQGTSEEGASTEQTTSTEDALPDGALISAAIWTLDWDTTGVVFPEGGGAELETDLGYRIHIDQGRILTHSVSFGPCDSASSGATGARTRRAPGWRLALGDWQFGLSVRGAEAHTENADPSMIEASLIEDLTAPHATDVDTSFTAARYCRAHYLLARPMTATKGPDDVPMDGRSVFVTGTFERDGETGQFTIDTWWPEGSLVDLDGTMESGAFESARASGEAHHAFVTVTRHLGRMFDGIDFEAASEDQVAGRTIDNLVRGVTFETDLWAPGQ